MRVLRWLPGVLIGLALAAGAYAVATGRIQLPRNMANVNVQSAATASPGLHTADAVIAAVKEYYRVTDIARGNGKVDLVDQVTFSIGSPANVNFREFMREQEAKHRHSKITSEHYADWSVGVGSENSDALYTQWLTGYDIDSATGAPLESENTTDKRRYRAQLRLTTEKWVLYQRDIVAYVP